MAEYKSKSIKDEKKFTLTNAYKSLYNTFKSLKGTRGRFIHIIGSPGTGKSINIYHALDNLDLNVYEPVLVLDSVDISSRHLFREIFQVFKRDFQVKTTSEVYQKASEYDMVLFADKFLDSEYLDKDKVGVSKWIEHKGFKAISIYFLIFRELVNHRSDLKHINVVLHHSMVIRYKGVKYDFLADFGFLSRFIRGLMGIFFEYVQISYKKSEVIEIIKSHPEYKDEKQIQKYIERYGNRPRLIFHALENKL